MPDYLILAKRDESYQEIARTRQDDEFAALESVEAHRRTRDMIVIPVNRITYFSLVNVDDMLGAPDMVKVAADGTITRPV